MHGRLTFRTAPTPTLDSGVFVSSWLTLPTVLAQLQLCLHKCIRLKLQVLLQACLQVPALASQSHFCAMTITIYDFRTYDE